MLHVDKLMVYSAPCHQFGMGALLGYASFVEHDDLVGVGDGG